MIMVGGPLPETENKRKLWSLAREVLKRYLTEKQNGFERGRYERADLFYQLFCPGLELSVIKTVP